MDKIKNILASVVLVFTTGAFSSAQGEYPVRGTVVDQYGPVVGATVVEQGTQNGTATGLDGEFVLIVSGPDSPVEISCIGYVSQTYPASKTPSTVTLKEDVQYLEEVVVIGYGTARKDDMTGSIVAIKAEDLNRGAVTNTQDMLKGKVAGVLVTPGDGGPGSGSRIRIRGSASLNAANDPLIVIDGVPIAQGAGGAMSNPLDLLNPNDIESFSVLKDASAAAIYGSRASNGVIIITTKQGNTARPTVTANVTFGVSQLARRLDIMNASELLRYRNDYLFIDNYIKDGSTSKLPSYDVTQFANNTDWVDEITRTAFSETANVSVSGKGSKTRYYFSGGFNNTDGIIDGSGFKRGTARFSISHDFTKWLNV